jgi:hypothetical protein
MFKQYITSASKWFVDVAGIFLMWIIIHYIASNLYASFCAELTLFGLIKSVFVAQAPHCVAMRWIVYNGGNVINNMWLSIGMWFTGKIFRDILTK